MVKEERSKNSITLTIIFDGQWWVGIFERITAEGYSVAREVFGGEPTEPEVYEFILKNRGELRFSTPLKEGTVVFKKLNPKRALREAKHAQNKPKNMSKAQDTLRSELEKNKKQKKHVTAEMKEKEKKFKFSLKQKKRKEKHKGH